jgi:hypothetical protein
MVAHTQYFRNSHRMFQGISEAFGKNVFLSEEIVIDWRDTLDLYTYRIDGGSRANLTVTR